MATPATVILITLGLIAFNAWREGELANWLAAKFLNAGGGSFWPDPSDRPEPVVDATDAGTGAWMRPVPGAELGTRGYGVQRHPVYGDERLHAGVDIPAEHGAPVVASRPGRVTFAGSSGGYGYRVDVDHGGGVVTRYAHLSRLGARVGQTVGAGETLGQVGSTGLSTAPHLHFEIRADGNPIDPAPLLGAR